MKKTPEWEKEFDKLEVVYTIVNTESSVPLMLDDEQSAVIKAFIAKERATALEEQRAEYVRKVEGMKISNKEINFLYKQGFGADAKGVEERNDLLDEILDLLTQKKEKAQ